MKRKVLFIGGPFDRQKREEPNIAECLSTPLGPVLAVEAQPKMSKRERVKREMRFYSDLHAGNIDPLTRGPIKFKRYYYTQRKLRCSDAEFTFWALKDLSDRDVSARIFGESK